MASRCIRLAFLIWLGLTSAAFALEETPGFDLGEIVVRPFSYGHGIDNLPFSSSIITWNEIEKENIFSFSDALDELPGVKINRTGNFGRSDVQIRGLGDRGRKVMVLVDGRPTKMGLFGCTITQSLPVDNIQRIELIRGPASVLYGSDALGGAVNIVTRSSHQEGFNTNFRTSYGSFNTYLLTMSHSGNLDDFSYLLTGGQTFSDGFTDNSAYESRNYTLGLLYGTGKVSRLSFRGRYYEGRKEEPGPAPEGTWSDYQRAAVEIDYEIRSEKREYAVKAYRNFGEHFFSDQSNYRDYTNGLLLSSVLKLRGKNDLRAGAEFRQQAGEVAAHPSPAVKKGSWDKYEYSVYALYNHALTENLNFSGGGRYNIDEVAGGIFIWQGGVIYEIFPQTRLRFNRSGGFRAPQINDLYTFPPSNKDLKSERSVNYEAGLKRYMGERTYFDISFFRKTGENIIETEKGVFKNSGNFKFSGGEFVFHAGAGERLGTIFSYSYLDPGEFTRGRPGNKVNASLYLEGGRSYIRLGANHISSYYSKNESKGKLNDYTVVNSRFNYSLMQNLRAFIKADNILNEPYAIYVDLPGSAAGVYDMPGRNFMMGLSYDF